MIDNALEELQNGKSRNQKEMNIIQKIQEKVASLEARWRGPTYRE